MNEKPDMSGWSETTIRTPGSWANPTDMHRVFSELFCHESIQEYQQRTVEAGLRAAVTEFRSVAERKWNGDTEAEKVALGIVEIVLSHFDPDHGEWGGFFPGCLVCPLHEQPEPGPSNVYGRMLPIFSRCPGVPHCRAHEGVRVE